MRSQSVISKPFGRGGRRYNPYAFTEPGVAMLSSVLNSEKAILTNVGIMRVFTKIRRLLSSQESLARRLSQLERSSKLRFHAAFKAIKMLAEDAKSMKRRLLPQPPAKKRRVGFRTDDD